MTLSDSAGWLAAGLTLVSFSMRTMIGLRLAAIAANLCFILYGIGNGLLPVAALHILLLPCNVLRLVEIHRAACDLPQNEAERGWNSASRCPDEVQHSTNLKGEDNGS